MEINSVIIVQKREYKIIRIIILLSFCILVCPIISAQDTHQLDELIVKASKPLKELGLEKTSFDSLALRENIALSIADILAFHSSVFVKSYGRATLSTVSFRGTSPSHTQVTWNGMRINSPMLGMTDFSSIPAFFIDDAELLHGASSINVTGGGLGGLVKLGTNPDIGEGFNLQYIQGIGSFTTFDEFVRFGYRNKKWTVSTRVAYMSSPNDYPYINHDKKENIYDENHNIIGQYYPKEKNRSGSYKDFHFLQEAYLSLNHFSRLSINAWYTYSNRELPLLTTDYGEFREFKNKQREQSFRGVFDWNYSKECWRTDIKLGYAYTWLGYYYKREISAGNMATLTNARSKVNTIFGIGECNYNPNNNWDFDISVSAHQQFVRSEDRNIILQYGDKALIGYDKGRIELSGSASARWKPFERFGLSLVVREELFGNHWSPLIPAFFIDGILTNNGKLTARASISHNYRFPTLNDLYFLPGGNPNLKPEKGLSYDASLSFRNAIDNIISLNISLGWFDSYIDDWIIWLPTPKGFFSPKNIKRVHAYGVEIKSDLDFKFTKDWKLNLSGSYSYTPSINKGEKISPADQSVGKQLPYIPKNSASVTGLLSWKSWSLLYKWCYYSKRYTMSSNDYSLSGILPKYFMNNVTLAKEFNFRPLDIQLKLSVNNLFNEDYLSVLSHPMPGINFEFFIGITPKFSQNRPKKLINTEL